EAIGNKDGGKRFFGRTERNTPGAEDVTVETCGAA
ncbi:hypothetical protein A2U01_0068298, partial [Trifolium medium]|nr:hypothetical protein [Trifolium medium]